MPYLCFSSVPLLETQDSTKSCSSHSWTNSRGRILLLRQLWLRAIPTGETALPIASCLPSLRLTRGRYAPPLSHGRPWPCGSGSVIGLSGSKCWQSTCAFGGWTGSRPSFTLRSATIGHSQIGKVELRKDAEVRRQRSRVPRGM